MSSEKCKILYGDVEEIKVKQNLILSMQNTLLNTDKENPREIVSAFSLFGLHVNENISANKLLEMRYVALDVLSLESISTGKEMGKKITEIKQSNCSYGNTRDVFKDILKDEIKSEIFKKIKSEGKEIFE